MAITASRTTSTTVRAVIYCRISKDRFDQQLGVKRQEQDCRALCERNGWVTVEVIVDNDVEASSGRARPGYERMLEMVAGGDVDAVVAWDLDRLVRRPAQLEHFFEVADGAGMSRLATIGDNIDPTTGDGVLVARIKGAVAAEEVRKLGQRARRKHVELAERGRPSGGGNRCFGYERDGMTLIDAEAAALRDACASFLAGEPIDSICRRWNAAGVTTTAGGEWRGQTLRNLLRSPRIAGLRAHKGEIVGAAGWPAVVDRDTWERVEGKFRANSARVRTMSGRHRGFGYEDDGVTLVAAEASLIREACSGYLAGEPLESICRRWNGSGLKTTAGNEWRGTSLSTVLRSPRIAGLRQERDGSVVAAGCPSAVDRETWERVQAKFAGNGGRITGRRYLLGAGLAYCSKCGSRMSTAPVAGVSKYRCEKRPGKPNCGGMTVSVEPVDQLVADMVLYRLDSPALAEQLATRRTSSINVGEPVADIEAAESKLEELAQMWSAGDITRAEWMTARKSIEAKLDAARRRLVSDDRRQILSAALPATGVDLRAMWSGLPLGRQQAIVGAIVDRVVIHPDPKRGSRYFNADRVEVVWRA